MPRSRPPAARRSCRTPIALLPPIAAASNSCPRPARSHDESHRLALAVTLERDRFELPVIGGERIRLPGDFRGGFGRRLPLLRRQHQLESFCSSSLRFRFSGQWCGLHGGQELIPDQVQHGLHVPRSARDCDHGILLWQDDAELTECPVAAERPVATAPELVPVALVPITLRVAAIRGLAGSGRFDPRGRNELLSLPPALLDRAGRNGRCLRCGCSIHNHPC